MGDTPCSYITNAKAAFRGPPKNFVKQGPAKSRVESVKTNYELGVDNIRYESAAMFDFSKHQAAQQPVYKNYNERVDVITGDIMDKNQKNAGYERFTEGS